MGWTWWVQILIDVFRDYPVLTTDTPWLVRKGNTRGVPCELNFLLKYFITTGSSQQRHHGSSVRAIHKVSCHLWVQFLTDISYHCMVLTTDTPCLPCKNNSRGIACEFKFRLMYYITADHFSSYFCTWLFFLALILSICLTSLKFSKSTLICGLIFWAKADVDILFYQTTTCISSWLNCVILSISLPLWNGLLYLF